MFGKKKKASPAVAFDREKQDAILKCSICNGEQVAGFKDRATGRFTEVMLIRNEADLERFRKLYDLEDLTKEY